eukprot:TRINITY_DN7020_c0_g1_i3.p1 TRINITY_DN7020_c0_g1~~TRINITY_DN7020_c0_g1_i3.p1  ORF type:complete len:282 (+),score=65.01 TRINITY_DN7020_c0_g1_i3:158-1003(+)
MQKFSDLEELKARYFASVEVIERLNWFRNDGETDLKALKKDKEFDFTLLFTLVRAEPMTHKGKTYSSALLSVNLWRNPDARLLKVFVKKADPVLSSKIREKKHIFVMKHLHYKIFRGTEIVFITTTDTLYTFFDLAKPDRLEAFSPWHHNKALPPISPHKEATAEFISPWEVDFKRWVQHDGTIRLEQILNARDEPIAFEGILLEVRPGDKDFERLLIVRDLKEYDRLRIYLTYLPSEQDEVERKFVPRVRVQFKKLYRRLTNNLDITCCASYSQRTTRDS